MKGLLINGGKKLQGTVMPQGSKNAALPMIFASLIMCGTSIIEGVPDITDVRDAIEIISRLGAKCTFKEGALYINSDGVAYTPPSSDLTSKIRASSYLLGACLSRFGVVHMCAFGGCNFEYRPIDMHLYAASAMGARIEGNTVVCDRLLGTDIRFDKASVGATVNALLLSASCEGRCRIFSYAREPHVLNLIDYLCSAGADITVLPDYIEVVGAPLSSGRCRVIPDMIEVGTYLAIGLATGSKISAACQADGELLPFLGVMSEGGAEASTLDGKVSLFGEIRHPCKVITSPYPGFPTDLQPQSAPVMALFSGGEIVENVWLSRFGYLNALGKLGVKHERTGSCAGIFPSRLHSGIAEAPDLRGGAALLIAALASSGESLIKNSDLIHRGYENIVEKLRRIGADITEIQL